MLFAQFVWIRPEYRRRPATADFPRQGTLLKLCEDGVQVFPLALIFSAEVTPAIRRDPKTRSPFDHSITTRASADSRGFGNVSSQPLACAYLPSVSILLEVVQPSVAPFRHAETIRTDL
jgi:hypothetical protein